MQTPHEGMDRIEWGVLATLGAIFIAWVKKFDPRMILVWANEPLMQKHLAPIKSDISEIKSSVKLTQRVIDHMPGANEAHSEVKAENERWRA